MNTVHEAFPKNGFRRDGALKNDFSSAEIVNCPEFVLSVRRYVGAVLPYDAFFCSFGCLEGNRLRVLKLLHDSFPLQYFQDLAQSDGSFSSPLVNKWHASRRPVYFQLDRDAGAYPREWSNTFARHGLTNMVAHGKADMASGFFSSFSFYRMPFTVTQWHAEIIELLVPHLHDALLITLGASLLDECERADQPLPLTAEQQHILYWMQQGKTDWETSRILGLNERTVKYHVKKILTKLNATNRTHAVGKACESGTMAKAM
ncbi:DNA-binding CsgD family transcriptional regulator [Paucimonas lemoignei]|uniref:DNA-binding CsgD family transcriptional regulator n=1 Tax=Paucimonas lemoignei TaxID=29443 RepID=A0A4R3I190_PAULE|nr:helix-turn-helix transcriptional regulator [Paucimonas lemoignei]TCS39292.1 DNA-binding CsgD family transcriptional regulator [Paucimonas lemoignei]